MIELSVIIPTHNRADRLRVCLEALRHQTQPATDFEVIVVDDDFTLQSTFASKIGAITDPARALPLRRAGA